MTLLLDELMPKLAQVMTIIKNVHQKYVSHKEQVEAIHWNA